MNAPKNVIVRLFRPVMSVTFVAMVLMLAVSTVSAAPNCDSDGDGFYKDSGKWCHGDPDDPSEPPDPNDSDPCVVPDGYDPDPELCGSGGGGGSTAPDPYNLARASFATRVELGNPSGGVFADGVDKGLCDPYDYWDWQEALLPAGVGLPCETFLNSSNVSGGGRWFLISGPAGSDEVLDVIERWLVVDFHNTTDGAPCYKLDTLLYLDDPDQITENPDDCIDNLAVRLSADRILKPKANQQQLDFSIRWRPDPAASIYWPPWGYVSYIQPLYLRDPSADDPDGWTGCRVMSTRPDPGSPHDRDEAELLREIGPGQTELMGTYRLPLEVCVKRASN